MTSLAERVEEAMPDDEALETAIIAAMDPEWMAGANVRFEQIKTEMKQREGANFDTFWAARGDAIRRHCYPTRGFTRSLDAARKLVPDGWHIGMLTECDEDSEPYCCLTENEDPCRDVTGKGVTLVLSLAAAALRARGL